MVLGHTGQQVIAKPGVRHVCPFRSLKLVKGVAAWVPWTPGSSAGRAADSPQLAGHGHVLKHSLHSQALGGASHPCLCSPRGTPAADVHGD